MWLIALKILWELEMGAFAQRPKRALVVGHVGVTIYPEAQKKRASTSCSTFWRAICDHGIGARVGYLEVMHLPSFSLDLSLLYIADRDFYTRQQDYILMTTSTSNTHIYAAGSSYIYVAI